MNQIKLLLSALPLALFRNLKAVFHPCRSPLLPLLPAALCLFPPSTFAILRVWTGSGADANWSTAANWNPVGVPQDGDDLAFVDGYPRQSNNNDLVGRRFNSFIFTGTTSAYILGGNSVVLSNGINANIPGAQANVNMPLSLPQDVSYTGGEGFLLLNGDFDLAGHSLTLQVATNGLIGIGGVVHGTGNITKLGVGDASFGGGSSNTYLGTLTVTEGHFYVGKLNGNAVTGPLIMGDLYGFKFGYVTLSHPHQIADTAPITIYHGNLDLNGWDEAVGPLNLYEGGVKTGTATVTLLGQVSSPWWGGYVRATGISGTAYIPADVTFDAQAEGGLYLNANTYGPGGIIKKGCAEMLLGGTNTFTGAVTVNDGTLTVYSSSKVFLSTSGVTLNGYGTLGMWSAGITNVPLTITSPDAGIIAEYLDCTWAGPIYLNFTGMAACNAGDDSNPGNLTLTGNIQGPGGLWFGGIGTVTLTANNTYTGTTRSACRLLLMNPPVGNRPFAGPMEVGGIYSFLGYDRDEPCSYYYGTNAVAEARWLHAYQVTGTTLTVYSNGVVNLNNFNEDFGAVTFNGGEVDTGTGQFAIYAPLTANPSPFTATINGYLGLPAGDARYFNVGLGTSGCDLIVNAVLFGGATYFVKQGAGTMCLNNVNTFTGTTLLEGGTLAINNQGALGSAGIVIFDGATLRMDGAGTLTKNFEVVGSGVGGGGAVQVTANSSYTISGNILLDAGTTFSVGSSAGLGLNGVVYGTGPFTKIGPGILVFQGGSANTYSDTTYVNEGTMRLGKSPDGTTCVPGNLVIGTRSGINPVGTTALVVYDEAAAVSGTNVIVNGGSLYDLNGHDGSTTSVVLNNGGSIHTGAGTLSFSGSGGTSTRVAVNPGRNGASVISGHLRFLFGGAFFVDAQLFPNLLNPQPPLDLPASLADSFSPTIYKTGLGEMRLSGVNTFAATLEIDGGQVTCNNSSALGTTAGGTVVNNNGALVLDGGFVINNEALTLDSSNSFGALMSVTGSNTWTGPITLSSDAVINVNNYLQVLNTVSGPRGLTKIGGGDLQFWGYPANTYAGVTAVREGVLDAGRVAVVSIPGDVLLGDDTSPGYTGALRLLREQQVTTAANINTRSNGILWLWAFPSVPAPTPTVRTITGRGLVHIDPGTALTISNDVAFTYPGLVEGSGSLNKLGKAAMRWQGVGSPYTGIATLTAGDFIMDGTAPSMPVTVKANGFLHGDGQVGNVSVEANGRLGADSGSPDHQGGDLAVGSLTLASGSTVILDFYGTTPTGGNDQIRASGLVSLGSANFTPTFRYPPRDGDAILALNKTAAGLINGTFSGWVAGQQRLAGTLPVVPQYTGGDGNDVTLTVTNLGLAYFSYRLAEGNGNQTIEPDECNLLYVSLFNRRTNSITVTNAVLRSTTPGVLVTIPQATYGIFPPNGVLENTTPFQFRTDPTLACGAPVQLELVLSTVTEGQFAVAVTPFSGLDCTHPTGPCESCQVVSGSFSSSTPTTLTPLYYVGGPSLCYPPKACPGADPGTNAAPQPYLLHALGNTTTNEVCLTALLQYSCPADPTNAFGAAAYLGSFNPADPCAGYLGDSGATGLSAFSFHVPAGSNFVVVVSARDTNLGCSSYALQLFGLPCLLPTLKIAREAAPAKVRLDWSTAYPGWTVQQEGSLGGIFSVLSQVPTILNGRYTLTNLPASGSQFFRLEH